MIQRYTWFLLIIVVAASCKPKREDLLSREWQEISEENPQMETVMASQQQFIDTVGKHTSAEFNLQNYGVANVDSFRHILQANMDSFRIQQKRNIAGTRFDFRKNGTVYIHTLAGVDSSAWKFEEDGNLLLDGQKINGAGSELRMEVLHLSDTALRLRFKEDHSTNTANFVPVKK